MRTTLTIDDDVLEAAKSLALARQISIGKAQSELARTGMNAPVRTRRDSETGWLMFDVPMGKKIELADVQRALDRDDLRHRQVFPRTRVI